MSFLTPLYVLGALAIAAPDRLPPDPPDATGRGAVQLADVPVPVAAPADAPEPARDHAAAPAAGARPWSCWPWPSPGRSCARRPA